MKMGQEHGKEHLFKHLEKGRLKEQTYLHVKDVNKIRICGTLQPITFLDFVIPMLRMDFADVHLF